VDTAPMNGISLEAWPRFEPLGYTLRRAVPLAAASSGLSQSLREAVHVAMAPCVGPLG